MRFLSVRSSSWPWFGVFCTVFWRARARCFGFFCVAFRHVLAFGFGYSLVVLWRVSALRFGPFCVVFVHFGVLFCLFLCGFLYTLEFCFGFSVLDHSTRAYLEFSR